MQALVLAGGSGTRFWPLSRRKRPKQLLALEGRDSLLQQTVARLAPLVDPSDVWICTTRALADDVRSQLPAVPAAQVLAEPMGRNTTAAIGWSVHRMKAAGHDQKDPVIAVLPADHRVGKPEEFRKTLGLAGQEVAANDRVMTLGVKPQWAEAGYGYLEVAGPEGQSGTPRRVERFTEKPNPEMAQRFFESNRYLWNAGIFVFRAGRLLELLAHHQPEIWQGLERLAREPDELDRIYAEIPSISIDYAVMEKCEDLGTLPLDCEWSDLGSWDALAEIVPANGENNSVLGDACALDSNNNLLVSDQGTVTVVGVSNLVVVHTRDAVLVAPRGRSQEVKELVSKLEARGRDDLL